MNIGNRIKEYRNMQGLTQLELANKSNISRSYLADVEKNRYNASVETLQKIATALGISLSKLLTVEEKLELTLNSISTISDLAKKGLEYKPNSDEDLYFNETPSEYKRTTFFSQFEDIEFNEEEQKEIINFIKYVISKKENKL